MKTLLAFVLLTASVLAQQDEQRHLCVTDKKVALEWNFLGEPRVWLSTNYYGNEFGKEGWHPSFVFLVVKDYKPIVTERNGQWIISFTSPIAEGIP